MGDPAAGGPAAPQVLPADRRGHPDCPARARASLRPPSARARPHRPPGTGEPGMRGERQLLRLGEYLVGLACQQLPQDIREERYEEWAAELPAILHDPQIGLAPRRAMRMLAYAADTLRGTALAPGRIPRMFAALDRLLPVAGLGVVALEVWAIVQAPGDGLNYLRLAWSLFFVA